MKKYIAIFMAVALTVFCLAGCNSIDRLNYTKGLKKYVELCDIDNIVVDRTSEDYISTQNSIMTSELEQQKQEFKSGEIAEGDVANIDYVGKVNGVAFTGGTAEGYDLEIGSGSFIDGFEDQLIGVEVGKTVNINVTFPEGYNDSTDLETGSKTIVLSGKAAVFTVTVNSIKRGYTEVNDEFAKAMGFDSADKYMEDLKVRATKNYVYSYIIENSSVIEYAPDEDGNCYNYYKGYYTEMASYYSMSFEDFLASNQLTEAEFKNDILKDEMILYAIFDKMGLKVTDELIDEKAKELAEMNGTTEEELLQNLEKNYIEYIVVNNLTIDKLYETVTIKD